MIRFTYLFLLGIVLLVRRLQAPSNQRRKTRSDPIANSRNRREVTVTTRRATADHGQDKKAVRVRPKASDFQIMEDNSAKIESFQRRECDAAVWCLVDTSPSTAGKLTFEKSAMNFIQTVIRPSR
jgi:hypothetical protein